MELDESATLVVGAGVCGMAAAHVLAKAGKRVVLLEKQNQVGGLARSFRYGDYVFDIGPHRFHTGNKDIGEYIRGILGDEAITFPRRSMVYFKGKYYTWPIRPQSLVQLPPDIAVQAGFDLVLNTFRKYDVDSFETYILRQYGPTLYRHFFQDYSEKFLKIPCRDTHPDWAKTGINRAIIDDNVQMNNLVQLLKSTLQNTTDKEELQFVYPRHGMQSYCDRAARAFEEAGGELLTGVPNVELEHDGSRITAVRAAGRRWNADRVIWTAPLHILCEQLGAPRPQLEYLSMVMYNIEVRAQVKERFQWCYFGDKELIFNRVSNNVHFSQALAPWGCCGLEVEVTCMQGDAQWSHPEQHTERVIDDLIKVGLISRRDEVRDVHIERIPYSYPIYHTHYREKLRDTTRALRRWKNLLLAGRTGQFWYNNMDHSIGKALSTARKLLGQDARVEGADFGREDEEL